MDRKVEVNHFLVSLVPNILSDQNSLGHILGILNLPLCADENILLSIDWYHFLNHDAALVVMERNDVKLVLFKISLCNAVTSIRVKNDREYILIWNNLNQVLNRSIKLCLSFKLEVKDFGGKLVEFHIAAFVNEIIESKQEDGPSLLLLWL